MANNGRPDVLLWTGGVVVLLMLLAAEAYWVWAACVFYPPAWWGASGLALFISMVAWVVWGLRPWRPVEQGE